MPTTSTDPIFGDLLARLSSRLSLELWMITRRDGEELSVIASLGDDVGVSTGMSLPWNDTVCARMASGEGPRAAPDLAEIPAYVCAPVARRFGLGAYVGVPIEDAGGVVGTLCGFDRRVRGTELAGELPDLELSAGLIGRLWQAEREARTDSLTKLPNRRAWDETLLREEQRCRRFGRPAAVLAVDLDDFKRVNDRFGHPVGDEHLSRVATAIATSVRDHDYVARWGGDEFCVLAVECDESDGRALRDRVREELAVAGVPASLALGHRKDRGLAGAAHDAFASLGAAKLAKPGARGVR